MISASITNPDFRATALDAAQRGVPVTFGVIGTSIEAGNAGQSWINYALSQRSNAKLINRFWNRGDGGSFYVDNGGDLGIAEGQLDNVISDFNRVTGPKICVVGAGFNDFTATGGGGASMAKVTSAIGHWKTITSRLMSNGILPIFCGATPGDSKEPKEIISFDRHLALYCELMGLPYFHMFSYIADAKDSTMNSTYSGDGTHPNIVGCRLLADRFLTWLDGNDQAVSPWLQLGRADVHDSSFDGLNSGDVNSNCVNASTGAADLTGSWAGSSGTTAASKTTGDVLGHWAETKDTTTERSASIYPLSTTAINDHGIAAGDIVRYAFRIETDSEGHDNGWRVRTSPGGGTVADVLGAGDIELDIAGDDGITVFDGVHESGQTNMRMFFIYEPVANSAGTYGFIRTNGVNGVYLNPMIANLGL